MVPLHSLAPSTFSRAHPLPLRPGSRPPIYPGHYAKPPQNQPALSYAGVKPPINIQISELHRKIQLLEGDRKSFYESTQWTIKKNKETIKHLREENKISYQKLSDLPSGEEKIVRWVIKECKEEKPYVKNKNGEETLAFMDYRLQHKIKQLNALRHETELRQQRLEELQLQYSLRELETNEFNDNTTDVAKTTRNLENRLEKARMKADEAEHITKVYLKLKAYMQEEGLNFENKVNAMEDELIRLRHEFSELQIVNQEATDARDAAKSQLQKLEENLFVDRKDREMVLTETKKKMEEKKLLNERIEKKTQQRDHTTIRAEEVILDPHVALKSILKTRWTMYQTEVEFDMLRIATGIADPSSVVNRFLAQSDTFTQLESLKQENEAKLTDLKQEKQRLKRELIEVKYSGEARFLRNKKIITDLQKQLKIQENRVAAAKEKLESTILSLQFAKAEIEHLAFKLQHILVEKSQRELDPNASDYVLNLLAQIEEKLLKLQSDMEGHSVPDLLKQLTDREYYATLEGKLPAHNTRISLPVTTTKDKFFEEEESGDETREVVTRASLKFQSQKLIESKSKKRSRSRKRS